MPDTLVDSYSETNYDVYDSLYSTNIPYVAHSFTGINVKLTSCEFYLATWEGATGNIVAKLYTHSGTYGESSKPTGVALATSELFDVSTLTESFQLIEFFFTGANQYSLSAETYYCIAIGAIDEVEVYVGEDSSSPSHGGNYSYYDYWEETWVSQSNIDVCFYVYGIAGTQHQIAGVSDVLSAITGSMLASVPIAIIINGLGAIVGAMAGNVPVSGLSIATTSILGNATATLPIAIVIGSSTTISGDIRIDAYILGTNESAANIIGILLGDVPISGICGEVTTLIGEVSVLGNVPITVTVNGISTTVGVAIATLPVITTVSANSTILGNTTIAVYILGASGSATTIAGILLRNILINNTCDASGSVVGAILINAICSAICSATSNTTGSMRADWITKGVIGGISYAEAFPDMYSPRPKGLPHIRMAKRQTRHEKEREPIIIG